MPTKEEFDRVERLTDHLPNRWIGRATVMAALTMGVIPTVLAQRSSMILGRPAARISLTEAGARAIVIEEAKKAGIDFSTVGKTLDLSIKRSNKWVNTKVRLDGTDKKLGISYDFVSEEEAGGLLGTSRYEADTIQAAKALEESLAQVKLQKKVVVFSLDKKLSQREQEKKLREQVKDYIKWLKSQGVI